MKKTLLILALLASGCATRRLDNLAYEVGVTMPSDDIRFSYEVKQEFSTQYFGMVNCVFENFTNEWVTVDSIEITSDSVNSANIAVTGGEDLDTWFESMDKAKQIESANKQMLWGTIAAAAAVGAEVSKDERVKRAAAVAAITGGTIMTLERFNMFRNELRLLTDYFPDHHLMRTPFRIPPGLGVDKWIVINTQISDKYLVTRTLKLKIYYSGKNSREYSLILINGGTYPGGWQSNAAKPRRKPAR